MKLFNVPIEPLEERYSAQWDRWFESYFATHVVGNDSYQTILGDGSTGKITDGAFLDVADTLAYKTSQMLQLLRILPTLDKKEKVVVFFHDLWFPGLENLFYLRDGLGLTNLKICGCLHAGTYDQQDFLYRKGMARWGRNIEKSWFNEVDAIFLATWFHKELVRNTFGIAEEKLQVTWFPMLIEGREASKENWATKSNIVVYPHRTDPEKQPEKFEETREILAKKGMYFVRTKDVTANKAEYYDCLSTAKIAVSYALQETWGIAMQEAVLMGCIPLVPDRLSYAEMYPPCFKYKDENELHRKIEEYIQNPPLEALRILQQHFWDEGASAIPAIYEYIHHL